jgi:hypothetical protein
VIGFEPRPLLKITPPPGATDKRIRTFTYIEAVQKLRCVFSNDDIDSLVKQLGTKYTGMVKSLFVVIDDDTVREARKTSTTAQGRVPKRGHAGPDQEAPPRQRSK